MTVLEEIKKALEGVTPGPWEVYSEKVADKDAAIAESAYQVEHTDPFVGEIFMLNAGGKCPALTGCGPCSEANARYIAAVNPASISELLSTLEILQRENEELRNLADRLKQEAQIHAMEARGANSTVAEIYQIISGARGEPGIWNGAEPVRKYVGRLRDELDSAACLLETLSEGKPSDDVDAIMMRVMAKRNRAALSAQAQDVAVTDRYEKVFDGWKEDWK